MARRAASKLKASKRIAQVADDLDRKDWTNLGGSPERVLLTAILHFLDELDERVQALERAEKLRVDVAKIEDITEENWPVAKTPPSAAEAFRARHPEAAAGDRLVLNVPIESFQNDPSSARTICNPPPPLPFYQGPVRAPYWTVRDGDG